MRFIDDYSLSLLLYLLSLAGFTRFWAAKDLSIPVIDVQHGGQGLFISQLHPFH